MARLHDSNGNLLGGWDTSPRTATLPPSKHDTDVTIIGLECAYGSLVYSYSEMSLVNVRERARRHGCHNPIEKSDERHYCDQCGGAYCEVHANPEAHDCTYIVHEK